VNKRIGFEGIMRKLEIKALPSMDKGGKVVFEFNASDDKLVSALNAIMKADQEIFVVVMEKADRP